jgi:hypothetical protein
MEDKMATSNPRLKLTLDHYVIVQSAVGLTVTLSRTLDELKADGITLAFKPDVPNPQVDGKVVTAQWSPPGGVPGKASITASLIAHGHELASESAEVSMLPKGSSIEIAKITPQKMQEGGLVRLEAQIVRSAGGKPLDLADLDVFVNWVIPDDATVLPDDADRLRATWDTTGMPPGIYPIKAQLADRNGTPVVKPDNNPVESGEAEAEILLRPLSRGDVLPVTLRRTTANRTKDQILWSLVRERTGALSFVNGGYKSFVDKVLCDPDSATDPRVRHRLARQVKDLGTNSYGMAAYELLKTATEVYLLIECGVAIDKSFDGRGFDIDAETERLGERVTPAEFRNRLHRYFSHGRLPYLDRVVNAVFPDGRTDVDSIFCPDALSSRVSAPCLLELIWSYWHEEGMLVQTMNAISRRFQNVRGPGDRDPLAHLEIDPLRPLNNILWGYIQDEQNLLTVKRRAYEYDHHYGLTIHGKAVPPLRPADSRSKFLEGFHNLLHVTSIFYKEDNDTTVIADGFPLLNALREVHLLLAQGAHNQFGDLPWTARAEMLMQQWLLSQPQMREFLQSRPMVPYKEPWMAQVDTMKTLQGWSDVTVTHFRDLGTYGEQILLTVRYGDWIDINDEDSAKNWARYWRPEIQSYIHAYRTVTGIDLTNPDTVDYTMPAVLLQKRLAMQRAR